MRQQQKRRLAAIKPHSADNNRTTSHQGAATRLAERFAATRHFLRTYISVHIEFPYITCSKPDD